MKKHYKYIILFIKIHFIYIDAKLFLLFYFIHLIDDQLNL